MMQQNKNVNYWIYTFIDSHWAEYTKRVCVTNNKVFTLLASKLDYNIKTHDIIFIIAKQKNRYGITGICQCKCICDDEVFVFKDKTMNHFIINVNTVIFFETIIKITDIFNDSIKTDNCSKIETFNKKFLKEKSSTFNRYEYDGTKLFNQLVNDYNLSPNIISKTLNGKSILIDNDSSDDKLSDEDDETSNNTRKVPISITPKKSSLKNNTPDKQKKNTIKNSKSSKKLPLKNNVNDKQKKNTIKDSESSEESSELSESKLLKKIVLKESPDCKDQSNKVQPKESSKLLKKIVSKESSEPSELSESELLKKIVLKKTPLIPNKNTKVNLKNKIKKVISNVTQKNKNIKVISQDKKSDDNNSKKLKVEPLKQNTKSKEKNKNINDQAAKNLEDEFNDILGKNDIKIVKSSVDDNSDDDYIPLDNSGSDSKSELTLEDSEESDEKQNPEYDKGEIPIMIDVCAKFKWPQKKKLWKKYFYDHFKMCDKCDMTNNGIDIRIYITFDNIEIIHVTNNGDTEEENEDYEDALKCYYTSSIYDPTINAKSDLSKQKPYIQIMNIDNDSDYDGNIFIIWIK